MLHDRLNESEQDIINILRGSSKSSNNTQNFLLSQFNINEKFEEKKEMCNENNIDTIQNIEKVKLPSPNKTTYDRNNGENRDIPGHMISNNNVEEQKTRIN